jgi:hypothetical protein
LCEKDKNLVLFEKVGRKIGSRTIFPSSSRSSTGEVVKQILLTESLSSWDLGDLLESSCPSHSYSSSSTSQEVPSGGGQSFSLFSRPPSENSSNFTPIEAFGDDEFSEHPMVTHGKPDWRYEILDGVGNLWHLFRKPKEVALFLVSDPEDQSRLWLMNEIRAAKMAIRASERNIHIRVEGCLACQVIDILPEISNCNPSTLILSCHGRKNFGPVLQDDNGNSIDINPEALADLFSMASNLRFVILNVCYSNEYAQDMADRTGALVVAFRGKLYDQNALTLSSEFLRQRANGLSYLKAYERATVVAGLTACDGFRPGLFWPTNGTSEAFAARTLGGGEMVPQRLRARVWLWRFAEFAVAFVVYMLTGNMANSTGWMTILAMVAMLVWVTFVA